MRQDQKPTRFDGRSLITPQLFERFQAANMGAEQATLEAQKNAKIELLLVLEFAKQSFERGSDASGIIATLTTRLHALREKYAGAIWKDLARAAREHPVMESLLQDPLTRWSYEKPRGYSGDAGLIDLIYQHPSKDNLINEASPLGKAIYNATIVAESSIAVRDRRDRLARLVDETAESRQGAEILSIACGHLRESEWVKTLGTGKIKRWVAMDQDEESLAVVREKSLTQPEIVAQSGNVAGLIRRSYQLGLFDFVYAAGLYDYLSREVSIRLTQRMMELVKPGGELLFANFSEETATDGYMESFMNWPLILRTKDDMWDIVNASIDRNKVDAELFAGENRFIYYVRLRKKAD